MSTTVFIHHSVNPYRVGLFEALYTLDQSFVVYFLSSPATNRKWKSSQFKLRFSHHFFSGWKLYVPGNDHSYFQINVTAIWKALVADNPEVIVSIGWNYLATYIGWIYAKLNHKRFIIWTESTAYEPSWQRTLLWPLIWGLLHSCDHIIAAGTRAADYVASFGISEQIISIAYYAVNNHFFRQRLRSITPKQAHAFRQRLAPQHHRIILFIGQFISRKGIAPLLECIQQAQSTHPEWKFVLVGYGPLEKSINQAKHRHQLNNLAVHPFVQPTQLVKYLKAADCLVLPSLEETWGLVVNEALLASLPVVASRVVGSSQDLLISGQNGIILDTVTPDQIEAGIVYCLQLSKKQVKIASQPVLMKASYQQNVKILQQVLHQDTHDN